MTSQPNKQTNISIIEILLSIPKSFFVCLKLFGLKKALKLPIFLKYNTKVLALNGSVTLTGNKRLVIGFGKISEIDNSRERSIIKFNGNITIDTPCNLGPGSKIISEKNSKLVIGAHFNNTAKVTISNRGNIIIGRDCLLSWNTWICDTDFHHIIDMNLQTESHPNGTTKIGNHVWICSNSAVIKGAEIPNGCIVATGAIVNKAFIEENCLLAGVTAVEKKHHISWRDS